MKTLFLSALVVSSQTVFAASYYLSTSGSNLDWNATNAIWRKDNEGASLAWNFVSTTDSAIIQTTGASTLTLSQSMTLASIVQGGSSSTTIGGLNSNVILTLSGAGEKLQVTNDRMVKFLDTIRLALSPTSATDLMTFNTGAGYLQVDGILSGSVGSLVGSTVTGGLEKTGSGTLYLNGNNTYTGFTRLKEGVVEAGSATAFGTSKIYFEGGTLKYKSGVTQDFSSQFHTATGAGGVKIDTNGNNVTFATSLTGSGAGFTKSGAGTLTLAKDNLTTGTIEVRQGVLKGNIAGLNSFSSVNGTTIKVYNGAALDVNAAATTGHNWGLVQYALIAEGKGVVDTSKAGGYSGAIYNTESLTGTKIFSSITLTGDTTISGNRWDIANIDAQGFTITKVGGDIAWGGGTKSNIGDINIEQGRLYADVGDFGTASKTISVNASHLPDTTTVTYGILQNYGITTIVKQIRLNGGDINTTGTTTANGSFTFDATSTVTLQTNLLRENNLNSLQHNKDLIFKGKVTGSGGFTAIMSNQTLSTNAARYSVLSLLNSGNDFTGNIKLSRGILRLSDGALHGTLGNANNNFKFTSALASGIVGSSTDTNTFLDLFGTSQNLGSLDGDHVSHHVINNRAGTTSTLSVGNGNANGNFAGTLRDSYVLPNALITGEGTTGVLNFTKKGTGTQILSNANLYSGITRVEAGTLLLRNTAGSATGTSSLETLASSGARVGGTGSITGGSSKSITLSSGTFLMVGNSHQSSSYHAAAGLDTAAKTFNLGSNLNVNLALSGTIQVDLFSKTSSDLLLLNTNGGNVLLNSNLEVALASTANTSNWEIGDKWKVVDWNGVTGSGSFTQSLQLQTTTLAGFGLIKLVENGALYVQLVAIPEPSRAMLLLGSVLGWCVIRRRK